MDNETWMEVFGAVPMTFTISYDGGKVLSVQFKYGHLSFMIDKDQITITSEVAPEHPVEVPGEVFWEAAMEWQRNYGERF